MWPCRKLWEYVSPFTQPVVKPPFAFSFGTSRSASSRVFSSVLHLRLLHLLSTALSAARFGLVRPSRGAMARASVQGAPATNRAFDDPYLDPLSKRAPTFHISLSKPPIPVPVPVPLVCEYYTS